MSVKFRRPSLINVLVVLVFVSFTAVLVALTVFPLEDSDIWFHLKGGEWLWQHHRLLCPDPFSYTMKDRCWDNLEWGGDVLVYAVTLVSGLNGIIIAKAALITITFLALLVFQMQLTGFSLFGVCVLMVAVLASVDRFMERLEHLGYFFLALEIGLLFLWRKRALAGRSAPWRLLVILPVIFFLWANLHPTFTLGIILFGMVIGGELGTYLLSLIRRRLAAARPRGIGAKVRAAGMYVLSWNPSQIISLRQWGIGCGILLISAGATLLNPYLGAAYQVISSVATSPATPTVTNIIEWQSPFDPGHRDMLYTQVFFLCLGVYWLVLAVGWIKNGVRIADAALLLLVSYLSLHAVRHINVFAVVGFLPAMASLGYGGKRQTSDRVWNRVWIGSALLLVLVLGGASGYVLKYGYKLGRVHRTVHLGKRPIFADGAIKFLDDNNIYGNVFNQFGMGGYLMYAGYPKRKVFIDGRGIFPGKLFADHGSVGDSPQKAQEILDAYHIDYVIWLQAEGSEKGLPDYLSDDKKNWALVYWDQYYLVYLRRTPEFHEVIARYEYTYGDPILLKKPETIQRLSKTGKDALKPKVRTAGELSRAIEQSPANNRARVLLGGIFELIPDLGEARKIYLEAITHDPDFPLTHFLLGNLSLRMAQESDQASGSTAKDVRLSLADGVAVDRSLWEEAKKEFATSYRLDPTVAAPLLSEGQMLQKEGNIDETISAWTRASLSAPSDPQSFYLLGILYSNDRYDPVNALYYLQRYLLLARHDDPGRQRAEDVVSRLKPK